MSFEINIQKIGSIIGESNRAKILTNLMSGKALTAGELARNLDISPQITSNHLKILLDYQLIVCIISGRFRYYKLISEDVALLLESIANFNLKSNTNSAYLDNHRKIDKKLAFARSCYHHLAGYLGVKLTEYFINEKMIKSENERFNLTEKGDVFFKRLSIDVKTLSDNKKPLLKPCLDFSERRYHMAGNLANLFLDYLLENRYLLRSNKEKRALLLTDKGRVFLSKLENFSF